ncbi:hypothetical protein MKW98_023237 [Papaver atlanticum]|uniref:UvrD-like helicase ATP-binding domain-containing protein n=1 Tax=Papaver atlanticum TaxID=357466 RepID=A0AAD4TD07_9MAGN|nr:hypothetical protein MKW98_023237 [Papaver atlanticum]
MTKKLDSSMVFTEIISHIKGGLFAGRLSDDRLSREEYILLSEGRVSSVSKERREMIYDIFLEYEKKKILNDEFDLADFVIDLHRRLKTGCYQGDEMDFVYIDEVQDLTMRQIGLLKYICRNFVEGFVFSGDTAQTIAGGVDFRFQDVRSLFYSEFILDSGSDGMGNAKHMDQSRISDIYHLNQNFRTHAGVLNLSESVIELLYIFFPHHIDNLSPETSLIYGEAPIWLESASDDNAIITIFGKSGENVGRSTSGFGAEQVILVRDDSVRKEIADHIGKQALVPTIAECKGLEFQDVLLYNFFGTSPLNSQWRVVYGYMKEQNLLDSNDAKFPKFSEEKHQILCSELKQLYVAITHTRQRLWICNAGYEQQRGMEFTRYQVISSVRETIPWGNLRCNSSSFSVADSKKFSERSFNFVASKIKEILSSKLEWLWKIDFDNMVYYPRLVFKLVLLVTLICLNSGCHFDLLYSLLSRYDITTVLPPTFVKILEKRGTRPFDKVLAESLETIGDPLVCLRSGDIQRVYLSHNVLEIYVDLIHSREDLLGMLYPENMECDRNDEMEIGSLSDGNVSFSNFDHMSCTEGPIESDDDIPDYDIERTEMETDTGNFDDESSMNLFKNTIRVYMFSKKTIGSICSFHTYKPQMKLDICICFVENALPSCKGEQWMREMKQLSFALSASDENPDVQYSQIDNCFKKLAARTPKLKKLLNGLLRMITNVKKPMTTKIKSEETLKSKKHAERDISLGVAAFS